MQAPRAVEKQSEVLGHHPCVIEYVRQHRTIRAWRMHALQRLIQLLRVAQQQQALGATGRGQRIRQRHLPGLVDAQHVHQALRVVTRPEPGSSTHHVKRSPGQGHARILGLREGYRVGEFGLG